MSCSFVNLEMILVDNILFRFSLSFNYLIDTIWILESWLVPLFNELGIVFTISSNLAAFIYACINTVLLFDQTQSLYITFYFWSLLSVFWPLNSGPAIMLLPDPLLLVHILISGLIHLLCLSEGQDIWISGTFPKHDFKFTDSL